MALASYIPLTQHLGAGVLILAIHRSSEV
uniref:Uncharacterized protein n=1 Tax=Arundo donax TaxID=35708 RepID=A0A0A9CAV2_ARUDO